MYDKCKRAAYLDALQDGRIEYIQACIYFIGNEIGRLLNETIDGPRLVIIDNSAKTTRLVHLCYLQRGCEENINGTYGYSPLSTMWFVEVKQFFERVVTYNITIQHEKRLVIVFQPGGSVDQGASLNEWFEISEPTSSEVFIFVGETHLNFIILDNLKTLKKLVNYKNKLLTVLHMRQISSFKHSVSWFMARIISVMPT